MSVGSLSDNEQMWIDNTLRTVEGREGLAGVMKSLGFHQGPVLEAGSLAQAVAYEYWDYAMQINEGGAFEMLREHFKPAGGEHE